MVVMQIVRSRIGFGHVGMTCDPVRTLDYDLMKHVITACLPD